MSVLVYEIQIHEREEEKKEPRFFGRVLWGEKEKEELSEQYDIAI